MSTRTKILRAAEEIIRTDGARAMTLEAVAARAGVSKGGLLYHFRSKRDLITGMGDDRIAEVAKAVRDCYREAPERRVSGAYVASLETAPLTELDLALLAMVAEDPALLAPYRDAAAKAHQAMTAETADPALATIVRLAVDGLSFAEVLGFDVLAAEERSAVIERLSDLAAQALTGSGADQRDAT